MNRFRQTTSLVLMLALLSVGVATTTTQAQVQRRAYRMTDRQVEQLIRRVETSADRFRDSLANSLDRSRYQGTGTEDNINAFVQSFENATDQLRDRFNRRVSVASDVELVLRQAAAIDDFMLRNRVGGRAQTDWALVRTDLDALARTYGVNWGWGQQSQPSVVGSQQPYRLNDQQLDAIIRRIENRTDTFRTSIDRALDRTRYDGTRAEDNINQFVRDFEQATDQLRDRFDGRRSVASDVEGVLQRAAFIDSFMRRNRLTPRAQNQWSMLRTDLGELATAYNVAWNWNTTPSTTYPGGNNVAGGSLTGTYRLDATRSDNPRDVADRATRNLPAGQRQRVYDNLLSRLESPEMLAIERRGMTVAIASSRAPQTTFDVDGRESTEQLPNGRVSRVTSRFEGEQLVVRSTGFRESDFTVTFAPAEGGRRLLVTREIWNERLGQNPIIVRNYYDRTSDVAEFNVYGGGGSQTTFPSGTAGGGGFVVPDGSTLVAELDSDLTTRTSQTGDRFTMTVRSPAQYEGAVIEGRVANVGRGGRVTGRSELALDFDTIRLRNGQTSSFAGFVESVRGTNGDTVQVDNEGGVRNDSSRGTQTAQRAAIGTAVGAIIGAIAGGGKGAAIGAIVGAGTGAGSVYVQGRDDLELMRGSEVTIRASAPTQR